MNAYPTGARSAAYRFPLLLYAAALSGSGVVFGVGVGVAAAGGGVDAGVGDGTNDVGGVGGGVDVATAATPAFTTAGGDDGEIAEAEQARVRYLEAVKQDPERGDAWLRLAILHDLETLKPAACRCCGKATRRASRATVPEDGDESSLNRS